MVARTFLTAEWRDLAMINYEIDPAVLRGRVPPGTELDAWNGRTFASMVGFLFLRTRVYGCAIPFHQNFEEVNLRFYVRRKARDGWRRGVVFIKEIVPRAAIAAVARVVYGERYIALPMRHHVDPRPGSSGDAGVVEYAWRHQGRWHRLAVSPVGDIMPATPGSAEEFITEHYWGYVGTRGGGSIEYRVEHPPWRVWQAGAATLECHVAALYGPEFVDALSGAPSSAFLAEGSPVIVRRGTRLG